MFFMEHGHNHHHHHHHHHQQQQQQQQQQQLRWTKVRRTLVMQVFRFFRYSFTVLTFNFCNLLCPNFLYVVNGV